MWICAILCLVCFIGFLDANTILQQILCGTTATIFLCTGLLIENLEKLFKKYFQDTNNKNQQQTALKHYFRTTKTI